MHLGGDPLNERRYRDAEQRFWNHHGLAPTERFVTLQHTGTRVRVQEVGKGEPVLFIHGGPNSGTTWAPLVAYMPGVRCLLVDRPGTGLSEGWPVRAETLAGFAAAFVSDVLDGLGLDGAHVVASSFGGHIALRSAAAHPSRFRGMVQMACPALSPGETLPPFMRLVANPLSRTIIGRLPPNRRAGRSILRQLGHGASLDAGKIDPAFEAWSMALQRHTDTHRNDFKLIASVISRRPDLELNAEILGRVRAPTRFLWGRDDTFGDEEVARQLVDAIPTADVVFVANAGHLPWLDAPERLAQECLRFLSSDPSLAGDEPAPFRTKEVRSDERHAQA